MTAQDTVSGKGFFTNQYAFDTDNNTVRSLKNIVHLIDDRNISP